MRQAGIDPGGKYGDGGGDPYPSERRSDRSAPAPARG
jgi:hypothetical protein